MKKLMMLLSLSLILVSCAQDRTADEYKKQKMDEELAKIQAISGVYSGEMVTTNDGSKVADLAIEIQAATRVGGTSDLPVVASQASIAGKVTIIQDTEVQYLSFKDGAYNSSNSTFSAETPVTSRSGDRVPIDINGTVSGETLEGTLAAFGFPENSVKFVVKRSSPNNIPTSPSHPQAPVNQSYQGNAVLPGDRAPSILKLSLVGHMGTPDQEFLDHLTSIRTVDVNVALSDSVQAYFPNAQWDTRAKTLKGYLSAASKDGGDKNGIQLYCLGTQSGEATSWTCRYTSNTLGVIFETTFAPITVGQ